MTGRTSKFNPNIPIHTEIGRRIREAFLGKPEEDAMTLANIAPAIHDYTLENRYWSHDLSFTPAK